MSEILEFVSKIPPPALLAALYFLFISLVAMIVTYADKRKAEKGKWRVPEATLLIISALGGSVFMLISMLIIRHKTKKLKFMLGIPLIIAAQIALAALCFYFF